MTRLVSVFAMSVVGLAAWAVAGHEQSDNGAPPAKPAREALPARSLRWQESLDGRRPPNIRAFDRSVFSTKTHVKLPCEFHVVYDPKKPGGLELRFVRDETTILAVWGHRYSGFAAEGNTLYFADYRPTASGCAVACYDLTNGKELWRTPLAGVGDLAPGAADKPEYVNRVFVRMLDNAVKIIAHETVGDYAEILDQKTGKQLAHKVFKPAN